MNQKLMLAGAIVVASVFLLFLARPFYFISAETDRDLMFNGHAFHAYAPQGFGTNSQPEGDRCCDWSVHADAKLGAGLSAQAWAKRSKSGNEPAEAVAYLILNDVDLDKHAAVKLNAMLRSISVDSGGAGVVGAYVYRVSDIDARAFGAPLMKVSFLAQRSLEQVAQGVTFVNSENYWTLQAGTFSDSIPKPATSAKLVIAVSGQSAEPGSYGEGNVEVSAVSAETIAATPILAPLPVPQPVRTEGDNAALPYDPRGGSQTADVAVNKLAANLSQFGFYKTWLGALLLFGIGIIIVGVFI